MTTTSTEPTVSATRKIRGLAVITILIVLFVVAGWFGARALYAAAKDDAIARLAERGVAVNCAEDTLGGFPARFEWRCQSFGLSYSNGARLDGDAMTMVSPVWNPSFAIVEWAGPLEGQSAAGLPIRLETEMVRASLDISSSLELDALSAETGPVALHLADAATPVLTAVSGELHVRAPEQAANPSNREAVVLLLDAESAYLSRAGRFGVSFSGTLQDATEARGASVDAIVDDWIARSGRIDAVTARLRSDATALDLTGDMALNADRTISFDGTLASTDIAALLSSLGFDLGENGNALVLGANLLGRTGDIGGERSVELPVAVDRGALRIGPFELGVLPPLRF